MSEKSKIVLVSFADGVFRKRKESFIKEAESLEIFDEIHFHDLETLPGKFLQDHSDFIRSNNRGFGYWIWKPQVIKMALAQSGGNDIVIYLDAGFTLNPSGRERMREYVNIARDSPYKMLSFQNVHTESHWTKMDLAKKLSADQSAHIMSTSQLSAGFLILMKTSTIVDLVHDWQNLAVEENYRYSDDSPSFEKNHTCFKEHRHDQSISSLLRKLHGTTISHHEVQLYDVHFESQKELLPIWKTRSRT